MKTTKETIAELILTVHMPDKLLDVIAEEHIHTILEAFVEEVKPSVTEEMDFDERAFVQKINRYIEIKKHSILNSLKEE